MTNHCGTCTACCRVFHIEELKKPAGKWCDHCHVGVGCKIYEQRPEPCVSFKCLWLESQSRPDLQPLGDELRPDRCKVVFHASTCPDTMAATTMPGAPDAWQRKPVKALIDLMVSHNYRVAIGAPASMTRLEITQQGERTVPMTPPDEKGMQYSNIEGATPWQIKSPK